MGSNSASLWSRIWSRRRSAAQRAEAAKGNEYFICRLLVLTIDGKQGYPAAQLAAAAAPPSPALPAFSRPAVCYTLREKNENE